MYDASLLLKDSGLVAATAVGTVGGSPKVVSLGQGRVDGRMFVDVSAVETDSSDELYRLTLQGAAKADFTGDVVDLVVLEVGATGRYEVPFTSERLGTVHPFVRLHTAVSGTVASGVNFTAYLSK